MSLQLLMFFLILCQICTSNDYELTKQQYRYFNRMKAGNILGRSHSRKTKEVNNCDSNVLQHQPILRRFMYNFVGAPSGKPKPNSKKRKSKDPSTIHSHEQDYVNYEDPFCDLLSQLM